MTKSEIMALDKSIITPKQLVEINESEGLCLFGLGDSGYYTGCSWWSVEFEDGDNCNVYTKNTIENREYLFQNLL